MGFDPDAYLASLPAKDETFDPDAYLASARASLGMGDRQRMDASVTPYTKPTETYGDAMARIPATAAEGALSGIAGLSRMAAGNGIMGGILRRAINPYNDIPAFGSLFKRGAQSTADFTSDAAQNAQPSYFVDQSRNDSTGAKIAGGAGALLGAAPMILSGAAGVPIMAAQALGSSKEGDYQRNLSEGQQPATADANSDTSATIKTAVTLPLYALGGAAANKITQGIAQPALKAGVRLFTNTAANAGASAIGRGVEAGIDGKPILPAMGDVSIAGTMQDAAFGAHATLHGAHAEAWARSVLDGTHPDVQDLADAYVHPLAGPMEQRTILNRVNAMTDAAHGILQSKPEARAGTGIFSVNPEASAPIEDYNRTVNGVSIAPDSKLQRAPATETTQAAEESSKPVPPDAITIAPATGAPPAPAPTSPTEDNQPEPPLVKTDSAGEAKTSAPVSPPGENAPSSEPPKQPPPAEPLPQSGSGEHHAPYGIANAETDKLRAELSLTPAMAVAKESFGQWWDEAMRTQEESIKNREQPASEKLFDELQRKPRPVNTTENALLLHREIELSTRRAAAQKARDEAIARNDRGAAAQAEVEIARARDLIQNHLNVVRETGTEQGRGLAARRILANEDYSYHRMEADDRATRPTDYTEAQHKAADVELDAAHKRIDELTKQAEQHAKDKEETAKQHALELAIAAKKAKTAKQGAKSSPVSKTIDPSWLAERAAKAKAKADESRAFLRKNAYLGSTIDPTHLPHYINIGVDYLYQGLESLAKWSAAMRKDAPSLTDQNLKDIHDKSRQQHASEMAGAAEKNSPKNLETKMKARIENGGNLSDLRAHADKLMEHYIRNGVTDPRKLVDAVHEHIKSILSDTKKEQTRDLMSGYGHFTPLDQDAVKVQKRDIKQQLQLHAKQEAVIAGDPLKRSGRPFQPHSEQGRKEIEKLNELARKHGIVVTDPETQLKNEQARIETRLKNQIKAIADQMETGEKPPGMTEIEYNQKNQRLRDLHNRMREVLDAIKERPEKHQTADQWVRARESSYERLISHYTEMLAAGKHDKLGSLFKPKISEEQQARLDSYKAHIESLNEERALLRMLDEPMRRAAESRRLDAEHARLMQELSGDHSVKFVAGKPVDTPQMAAQRQQNEAARARINEQRAALRETQGAKLQALKVRMKQRLADIHELEARAAAGDETVFSPRQKTILARDNEAFRIEGELNKARDAWQRRLVERRLANRKGYEKTMDAVSAWSRGIGVLSSAPILAKLSMATAARVGFNQLEAVPGGIARRLFPGLAHRAPVEGSAYSAKAEAQYVADGLKKGMKEFATIAKGGKSEIDNLYGKLRMDPKAAPYVEFWGNLHQAIKNPLKNYAFNRALDKYMQQAEAQGRNIHDPQVQMELGVKAFKQAERALFLQDNMVASSWSSMIRRLENPKGGDRPGFFRKATATAARVALPVVKIPTNMITEAITEYAPHALGVGLARAIKHEYISKSVGALREDQAEMIMRQLKRGSIGNALLALGIIGGYAGVLGGHSTGEKRKKGDIEAGAMGPLNSSVANTLFHGSQYAGLGVGADVGRALKESGGDPMAALAAYGAGNVASVDDQPFLKIADTMQRARNPHEIGTLFGEGLGSRFIPAAERTASTLMRMTGAEKKHPHGFVEGLESQIFPLDQTIPTDAQRKQIKKFAPKAPIPFFKRKKTK